MLKPSSSAVSNQRAACYICANGHLSPHLSPSFGELRVPQDSNSHQHPTQPAAAGRSQRASFQGGTGLGANGTEAVGTATAVTVLSLDELLEVLFCFLLHDGFTGPNICREDKKPADTVLVLEGYPFIGQRNKNLKANAKALPLRLDQTRALFAR